ncbi:MAG TPA: hypothetical protein VGI21_05535 [Streptosporangiaceae bacterium]|jgi:hypothetical protein
MDGVSVGDGYAEHVTEPDLRLISAATGLPEADAARLRRNPDALERVLADPRVFEAVFGAESRAAKEAVIASPFLAFAVAVHRATADLAEVRYIAERAAARQQVPVFDVPQLRDFLNSAARRLFLAELLTSFTRVTSGRYRVTVGGRSRTRRFSELDPVRLAGMLDAVPEESRPGVYRRLGDVALFLSGVFPDYVAGQAFSPVHVARLLRATHVPPSERERLAGVPDLELMEDLGSRWYHSALALAPVRTSGLTVVGEVADRFRQARRVLNHVADRYLIGGPGMSWFAAPGR